MFDTQAFTWAVGVEDTFIPQVHTRTGRVLDEYELTQHYRFWRDDLGRIADLGVTHVRYGIPWYRVNPAPGTFDWSWTDQVIPEMVQRVGLHPIVDLMHYGCPLWLEREFANPDYPARVAEYAAAFAERYRSLVSVYTPLNEPVVNATWCGRNAVWPPYLRGDRGYVKVLMALARGMSLTVAGLRAAQPGATIVHVEACERVVADTPELEPLLMHRLRLQYLPTDLLLGRVHRAHPFHSWLLAHGADPAHLDRLVEHPQRVDVMGVNFYPVFSRWQIEGPVDGPRPRRRYGDGADLGALLAAWHERYGVPVMVTETSDRGSVARRARWMDESIRGVEAARSQGVPVVGYTWFPVFSLVGWGYRRGRLPLAAYWFHMGLWELRDDGTGTLTRVRTPLVDRYAAHVARSGGARSRPPRAASASAAR